MITDNSDIFLLDNLEYMVVGGACGDANSDGVSQNGSDK
jgi:hypothetical protein